MVLHLYPAVFYLNSSLAVDVVAVPCFVVISSVMMLFFILFVTSLNFNNVHVC